MMHYSTLIIMTGTHGAYQPNTTIRIFVIVQLQCQLGHVDYRASLVFTITDNIVMRFYCLDVPALKLIKGAMCERIIHCNGMNDVIRETNLQLIPMKRDPEINVMLYNRVASNG